MSESDEHSRLLIVNPLTPADGTAINAFCARLVLLSFVIFDILPLWRSGLSVRVPGCQKLQMMAWPSLAQDAL